MALAYVSLGSIWGQKTERWGKKHNYYKTKHVETKCLQVGLGNRNWESVRMIENAGGWKRDLSWALWLLAGVDGAVFKIKIIYCKCLNRRWFSFSQWQDNENILISLNM